ncbi:MAG: CinA family nicotinamide mononucleotide deamidase-related protein [Simkania sp.]|nr:CinA family nicotinamide mononucleotide deamidase-related protein [Simkania sp.]
MTIEIIAIGDELLNGITINTNAAFISRSLSTKGYQVSRHTVLPDRPYRLEEGLKEALARSTIVITTGGLGPTCDDITRDVAANLFSSSFHTDEEVEKELRARYGDGLKSLSNQSWVPVKAVLLKNRVGTARGLLFSEQGKTLVLFPGVPQEMQPMFEEQFLPLLPKYYAKTEEVISKIVHFGLLTEDSVDPMLRDLQLRFPQVEFGIYPGYGVLSVRITSKEVYAIDLCKEALEQKFTTFLFEESEGKIEKAIHTVFTEKKLTLACAESCTGGQLAAKLTGVPGASHYFLASLITYSDAMKQILLGVEPNTLSQYGAVSRETVIEMVTGLLQRTGADIGLAVSGIAGPDGGTKEKPVGTVWIAIAIKGEVPQTLRLQLKGSRETITVSAVQRTLFFLWRLLAKHSSLTQWELPQ